MKNILYLIFSLVLLLPGALNAQDRDLQSMLRYSENHSLTYEEAIEFYTLLDREYPEAELKEMGMTDAGQTAASLYHFRRQNI